MAYGTSSTTHRATTCSRTKSRSSSNCWKTCRTRPTSRRCSLTYASSRAVVGAQLLDDIDDDRYYAVATFLTYFVEYCGAMIQADGEGFYEGDRVLVEFKH